MKLRFAVSGLLLAALGACGVYVLKYEVRQREGELVELRRGAALERQMIQTLRAEWAFLTRPERLAEQADQLALRPADPRQIAKVGDIAEQRRLELAQTPFSALLPSGSEVTLRFKPMLLPYPSGPGR